MSIFSGYITGENSLEQVHFHVMINGISRKELEPNFRQNERIYQNNQSFNLKPYPPLCVFLPHST
jgi:hypothetical protein